jgi:cytochrome c-type biogenesis protein CcmH/NrfG
MVTNMKCLFTMAVFGLPLLLACGTSEQKKSPVVHQEGHQSQQSVGAQAPYYPGLIEEYQLLVAEDPHNFAALVALGNAYLDYQNWGKAVEMYQSALMIDPRDAEVHAALGTAYRKRGQIDRSLAEYRLALKYEPGHLDARYNMGIIFAHDKKDYREAARVWQEILNLAPNYPEAERIRTTIAAWNKKSKVENR